MPRKYVNPHPRGNPKRGKMTQEDHKRLEQLIKEDRPLEEIAKLLNRELTQIKNVAKKLYGKGEGVSEAYAEGAEFLRELRKSHEWKFIKEHYNNDELEYFQDIYARLRAQFKNDIVTTEELQIFQLCNYQIQINRYNKARHEAEVEAKQLELEISDLRRKKIDDPQDKNTKAELSVCEEKLRLVRDTANRNSRELNEYSKQVKDIMRGLEATREQRIKESTNPEKNWAATIKRLASSRVERNKEAHKIGLYKAATEKAREKMRTPHKFANGEWDQPLLNHKDVRIKDAQAYANAVETTYSVDKVEDLDIEETQNQIESEI